MTREMQSRWALIIIAIVAATAGLKLADAVFAPLALAFVIAVVLSPLADFLAKAGVPNTASAVLSFIFGLALLIALILAAEPFVTDIYEQGPRIRYELRETLADLRHMLRGLDDVTEEVQKALAPAGAAEAAEPSPQNGVSIPSLTDALFLAPAIAGQMLIFGGGLFFILLCRADIYHWLARLASENGTGRAVTAECFRRADRQVSRYFLTVAMINTAFGVSVAAALAALGMPSAILWGAVAMLMNFIVYLGPALVAVSLLAAGVIVFDGLASALPAAAFVMLNFIEGQFVTPTLVGRQMQVNPLLVFLSLCLWLWLWGPIGGFVAIPVLVWGIAVTQGLVQPAEEVREAA